jgi:Ca2+-binding RTX toxin-like protein
VLLAGVAIIAIPAIAGVLASNVVASSRAGSSSLTTNENDLKPSPECSGITLTATVTGSGSFVGGNSADLILGSAGVDTIDGKNQDDCILGGAGDDALTGGNGNDVCIGGPGTDTFNSNCETKIQ